MHGNSSSRRTQCTCRSGFIASWGGFEKNRSGWSSNIKDGEGSSNFTHICPVRARSSATSSRGMWIPRVLAPCSELLIILIGTIPSPKTSKHHRVPLSGGALSYNGGPRQHLPVVMVLPNPVDEPIVRRTAMHSGRITWKLSTHTNNGSCMSRRWWMIGWRNASAFEVVAMRLRSFRTFGPDRRHPRRPPMVFRLKRVRDGFKHTSIATYAGR